MKLLALLFMLGLALASAVPQSSAEEHYEGPDEIDDLIHSSDSHGAAKNFKEILGQLRDHVKIDIEKLTDKAEKLIKKGSIVSGSIVDYLKTVSEKGKNKVLQLIYRSDEDVPLDASGKRIPSFSIPDTFKKFTDFLKKSDDLEKFKNLVENVLSKGSNFGRYLIETLRTRGKDAVIDIFNRLNGNREENFAPDRATVQ